LQGGNDNATVEQVTRLSAAPIPFLSAYANQQQSVSNATLQSQAAPVSANQSSQAFELDQNDEFDDFQGFQSTPSVAVGVGTHSAFQPVAPHLSSSTTQASLIAETTQSQIRNYPNATIDGSEAIYSAEKINSSSQPSSGKFTLQNLQSSEIARIQSPPSVQTQAVNFSNVAIKGSNILDSAEIIYSSTDKPQAFKAQSPPSFEKTHASNSYVKFGDNDITSMTHSVFSNTTPPSGSSTKVNHSGISIINSFTGPSRISTQGSLPTLKNDQFVSPVFDNFPPVATQTHPKISPPLSNEQKFVEQESFGQNQPKKQGSEDRYAAFSNLTLENDSDFQMFQDGSTSNVGSTSPNFASQQASNYTSIFDTSKTETEPKPDHVADVPIWEPMATAVSSSPAVSSNESSGSFSATSKSNSAKFDLFKSVLANSHDKTVSSPVQSDTVSVKSLELSLSHAISQQSLGTIDQSNMINRTPSPQGRISPQTKPRKYGPSFCDDDYDVNDIVPPPDMVSIINLVFVRFHD